MEATFDPSVDRQRVRGKEFSIMDPSGVPHLWRPEFHVGGFYMCSTPVVLIGLAGSSRMTWINSRPSKPLSSPARRPMVIPGILRRDISHRSKSYLTHNIRGCPHLRFKRSFAFGTLSSRACRPTRSGSMNRVFRN